MEVASVATRRTLTRWFEDSANDCGSKLAALGFETSLCRLLVLFNRCPRLLHLGLRPGPSLGHSFGPRLDRLLTMCFLTLKYDHARFPQPLFIVRGARFSLGNVGPRFFDGAFRSAVSFRQDLSQRLVHHGDIGAQQQNDKNDSRHGPEQ